MRKETRVLFIYRTETKIREYIEEKLVAYPEVRLVFPSDYEPDTLMKLAPDIDIMIGWKPTIDLLKSAKQLVLFMGPGAGAQHLVELFRKLNQTRSICLCNNHGNSYAVAQHTVAMLLTLTNKIISHHNRMAAGEWQVNDDTICSDILRDRKIGFLGYGAINRNVHRFLAGFDLRFAAVKRDWRVSYQTPPTPIEKYELKNLSDFLTAIDILIIAVPLTSKTKGLIGGKELELLGPDGLLVNVARGAVIDEKSLYNSLSRKTIAGAAIDVWYEYRPEPDSEGRKYPTKFPFHRLNNILLSPHRAASPFDTPEHWDDIIENIIRFAKGGSDFLNVMSLEHEY